MIVTRKETGDKLEVFVEGSIDTISAPKLSEFLLKAVEQGFTKLVIDFAKVDYISSAGLKTFLMIGRELDGKGSLVLKNMSSGVKQVFEITGFLPLFKVQ